MHLNIDENYITIHSNSDVNEVVACVNKHILKQECESMYVDVSELNMLDAAKIGALCSSTHFTKYPQGNIQRIVKNPQTRSVMSTLALKTNKISVKRPIISNFCTNQTAKVVAIR